jgi:sugar O-acyltransferase (sialic acid O-acetyltransferase NeuD family)
MNTLIIIGAGGHGKVVADIAACTKQWKEIVFADKRYPDISNAGHWSVTHNTDNLNELDKNSYDVLVAIGDNAIRYQLYQELKNAGFNLVNVIHPSAQISDYAELGTGNVIMAQAVVNLDTKIGDACIINTAATVDHDCVISDGVHISPGTHLAGQVEVGKLSWIGIGTTVNQSLSIGESVMLGAGAVVVNDIPDGKTAKGVPARF